MKLKRFLFGLLFSSVIGLVAERRGSLTRSGAAGAVITGTTIFGFGGLSWGLTLIYFFISSTLLSHFKEREKERVAGDKFSKGARRDIWQALANGGVGTLAALGYGLGHRSSGPAPLLAAFVGAMATANADTWATEIGTLSSEPPRLITSGEPTAPGTSGGVTLLGTGAAVAGAATVGAVAEALGAARGTSLRGRLPLLGLIGGVSGALTDSVLGATVQAIYWCPRCQKETEQRVHKCGAGARATNGSENAGTRWQPASDQRERECGNPVPARAAPRSGPQAPAAEGEETRLLRGFRWLDNDVVNFASTAAGALIALLAARKLARRA